MQQTKEPSTYFHTPAMQHCRAAVSNVAACLHTVSPSCCSAAVPLNIGQVAEEILTRSRPPFTIIILCFNSLTQRQQRHNVIILGFRHLVHIQDLQKKQVSVCPASSVHTPEECLQHLSSRCRVSTVELETKVKPRFAKISIME